MPSLLLRPDLEREAYRLSFRVRVPLGASPDELDRAAKRDHETVCRVLRSQGWDEAGTRPRCIGGPYPVVTPSAALARVPEPARVPGQPSPSVEREIRAMLGHVRDVPPLHPGSDVDWEYEGVWTRPTMRTEYVKE